MRRITMTALAALAINAHAVEYVPDLNVAYDIIQMHDTTTWEKVCETSGGVCDVPNGTYQVKLLDRNWNELVRLRNVSVPGSGSVGVHVPDLTAEVCALYQVLDDQSLLGALSVPAFCSTTYSLGDTGPGGGIVFYVTDGGLHGLEAAPADQGSAVWCVQDTVMENNSFFGPAGMAIGTGAGNTEAILEGCPVAGHAAEVASRYGGGGFDDWFLPSIDELTTMDTNIGSECDTNLNPDCNVGGFLNRSDYVDHDLYYWSSSRRIPPFSRDGVWYMPWAYRFDGPLPPGENPMSTGAIETYTQWEPGLIRAVRAF